MSRAFDSPNEGRGGYGFHTPQGRDSERCACGAINRGWATEHRLSCSNHPTWFERTYGDMESPDLYAEEE